MSLSVSCARTTQLQDTGLFRVQDRPGRVVLLAHHMQGITITHSHPRLLAFESGPYLLTHGLDSDGDLS